MAGDGDTEVGRIVGYLMLNRDDWTRGIEATKRDAAELGNLSPSIQIKTNAPEVIAQLGLVRAAVKDIGTTSSDASAPVLSLGTALAVAGSAVVPIAGGLTAAGAAAIGLGSAGLLAVKGIQAAIASGSQLGTTYTGQINQLKASLDVLEQTAARGVLSGFEQSVSSLQSELPGFNTEVAQSSKVLGDIGANLTGGLVKGFNTFAPLITSVEQEVDQLSARFEAWAGGPGGSRFASTLANDFQQTVPAVEALATVAAHLVAAFNPIGGETLSEITTLSSVIAAIPVDVLKAGATAFVIFRSAVAVTGGIDAATAALTKFSVATEAAAGGAAVTRLQSLSGTLAIGLSKVAPYAAALVAASLGANAAAKATDAWAYSNNSALVGLHAASVGLSDLLHLNLSGFWANLTGSSGSVVSTYDKYVQSANEYADALNEVAAEAAKASASNRPQGLVGPVALPTQGPELQEFDTANASAYAAQVNDLAKAWTYLNQQIAVTPVSKAADQYQNLQQQLQTTVDATTKFLDQGGPTITVLDGVAIGQTTWNAALAKTNGNAAAAAGLLQGMVSGLQHNQGAINDLITVQQRLSTFQSDAATKYHLTTAQVDLYTAAMGETATSITATTAAEKDAVAVLGDVATALSNSNTATQGWLAAVTQFDSETDDLTARVGLLGAALTALQGITLSQAGSNLTAVDATEKLATAIDQNRASISSAGTLLGQLTETSKGYIVTQPQLTAGALAIQQQMVSAGTAAIQYAQAIYQNTNNANEAYSAFEGLRSQFVATETQSLHSASAAQNLATQIFGIPKSASTFVSLLNKDNVAAAIDALTTQLGNFSKIVSTAILKLTDDASPVLNPVLTQLLNVNGKTFTANLQVNTVAPGGVALPGIPDAQSQGPVAKKAGGSVTGPGTSTSDSIAARLSNGEYVVKAAAAARNRSLLDAINAGAPGFATGGSVGPSLLVPTASKTAAATVKASQGSIVATAGGGVAYGIASSITAGTPAAVAAMQNLAAAVNDAFQLNAVDDSLASVNAQLKTLSTAAANLRSNVSTKLGGSVDASQFGDVGGLLAAYSSQTGANNNYSGELAKLSKEHLNSSLLQQLAADGPSAGLDTLAGASASQIAQVNKAYGAYYTSASSGGIEASNAGYGAQIASDKAQVVKLTASQNALMGGITKLVAAIAKQSKGTVVIKLNDKDIAEAVIKSNEFEGVINDITKHLVYS